MSAKTSQAKLTFCSRGHRFYKNSGRLVCPKCWSGKYKKYIKLENN